MEQGPRATHRLERLVKADLEIKYSNGNALHTIGTLVKRPT